MDADSPDITPAMVLAGVAELWELLGIVDSETMVRRIFSAMLNSCEAKLPSPPQGAIRI